MARTGALLTAPWTRAPLRLFGALGLFFGVFVAAALMTTVVSARPLVPASLGRAALRDDLAACPPATGLIVKRTVAFGSSPAVLGGSLASPFGPTDSQVTSLVAGVDGLLAPVVTLELGDVDLAGGGRTSAVQLTARTDAERHLELVGAADGEGVLLGKRAADALGVGPGDAITVTGGDPEHPVAEQLRVRAVFADLRGDADAWWCTLRRAIVGPLTAGALPFLFADQATLQRLASALGRPAAATWEVAPEPSGWTLPRARRSLARLGAGAQALATRFAADSGGGSAAADTQGSLGHAERAVVTATATVDPVALGAFGLAVLLLADGGRTWVERRRQQLVVFKLRGVGDGLLALKGLLELATPLVLGAAAGVGVGALVVRLTAPAGTFAASALTDAAMLAAAATLAASAVLAVVLLLAVRRTSAVASGGTSRRRRADGLLEVAMLVVAASAYYELRTRGSAIVGTGDGVHLDSLVLLFPVLLVAGTAGLLARVVLRPRFLRPPRRFGMAVWLAARRLGAHHRRAALVIAVGAVAVGVVAFASSLSSSLRATARAKATLGLGADNVVPVDSGQPSAAALPAGTTIVQRTTESTVVVKGHDPVDVIGVDPATFASAAYWDGSFATTSLRALLSGLGPAGADGRVPVIAAGPGVPDELSIEVRSAGSSTRELLDVRVVARARYFPGLNYGSTRSLVVVDGDLLRRRRLDVETQVWQAGTGTGLLDAVRASGAEAGVVRRASAFVDAAIVPQLRALDLLEVLGTATGAMAACALALHVTALGRRRVVGDALVRQMGLPRRTALAAGLLEVLAMLVAAWCIGLVLAWQALRMLYPYVDVSPLVLPVPLLRFDRFAPAVALGALVVLAVLTAVVLDLRGRRAPDDEVLRHAG